MTRKALLLIVLCLIITCKKTNSNDCTIFKSIEDFSIEFVKYDKNPNKQLSLYNCLENKMRWGLLKHLVVDLCLFYPPNLHLKLLKNGKLIVDNGGILHEGSWSIDDKYLIMDIENNCLLGFGKIFINDYKFEVTVLKRGNKSEVQFLDVKFQIKELKDACPDFSYNGNIIFGYEGHAYTTRIIEEYEKKER